MVVNATSTSEIATARITRMKRRLTVIAAISAGLIAGGGMIYFSGEAFLASRKQSEQQLRGQIGSLSSQSTQMQQDAIEATDAIALNDYLKPKLATNDFSLSRELLTQRMRQLSERFHLVEVGVRAAGVQDVPESQLSLSGGKEIYLQVDLEIQAPSDAHILRFVDALPVSLPGYIEVTSLELGREGALHQDTLLAIAQGVKSSTAKAKLTFIWRGIRPESAAPADGAAPQPQPVSNLLTPPVRGIG